MSVSACAICEKRKAERFCPAKGEKICAICCGEGREVTIDCPSDCPYLIAARRYEREHGKAEGGEEALYSDVEISVSLVEEHSDFTGDLGLTIVRFADENRQLDDRDTRAALEAMAATYKTLRAGIYYESVPEAAVARELYGGLRQFVEEYREADQQRSSREKLRDQDVFHLVVFFVRLLRQRTSGRPRSRAFLDFLRMQYEREKGKAETSRIIVP